MLKNWMEIEEKEKEIIQGIEELLMMGLDYFDKIEIAYKLNGRIREIFRKEIGNRICHEDVVKLLSSL